MNKNKADTSAAKSPYISSQNYLNGLNNTSAFSAKLSNYNFGFKLLILLARLITFVLYSVFYLLKIL